MVLKQPGLDLTGIHRLCVSAAGRVCTLPKADGKDVANGPKSENKWS